MVNNDKYDKCTFYPSATKRSKGPAFRYSAKAMSNFCVPDGADEYSSEGIEAFKKIFFESVYG